MKKTPIIIYLLFSLFMLSCGERKQNYDQYLKGKVKKESVAIAPKVAGRILLIPVNESQLVNKGDTLAIIEIPEIEAKLKQTQGAFHSAKAQYEMALRGATEFERKQIDAMHKAATEQFSYAEKSYQRLKSMYTDSLIPAQQYDDVYSKYMGAMAQMEAADARRSDIAKGTREEHIRMAYGDLLRAEGALQEAETAYAERVLIAPENMSIETIALKEGELALPGYNIFTGYLLNSIHFRFTIPEKKVHEFVTDTQYQIVLPYQPNVEIPAKLMGIRQLNSYASITSVFPEHDLGEAVYELKFVPLQTNLDLFTNMTVLLEEKQ